MDFKENKAKEGLMLIPRNVLKGFLINPQRYDKMEYDVAGEKMQEDILSGEFQGNRFPNSYVKLIPEWNVNEKEYGLGKYNLPAQNKKLNELIKGSRFSYEYGKNVNEMIVEGDFENKRDPFFTHSQLYIGAEEGYHIFDLKDPMQLLMIEALKTNNRVSFADDGRGGSGDVEFYIVSINYEVANRIKQSLKKKEVTKMYNALNEMQMRRIAAILGLPVDPAVATDKIDGMLFDRIDNPVKLYGKTTTLDQIVDLMKLPNEELVIRELVAKAIKQRVFTKRNNIYYYNEISLGISKKQVHNFLLNIENGDIREALRTEIGKSENERYDLNSGQIDEIGPDANYRDLPKKQIVLDDIKNNTGEEEE